MGKIVAIGGGEIKFNETFNIDKFIVEFSGVNRPKVLFIPTASEDAPGYVRAMEKLYGEQLGCEVDTLLLIENTMEEVEMERKILSSDIIYVGGGDTLKLLKVWRENSVDIYLKKAYEKGVLMAGLSAGAMCWFEKGHGDSDMIRNPDGWWDPKQPEGLNLISAIHCPHYDEKGHEYFDEAMKGETLTGIALENNTAFVVKDDLYKIVKANKNKKAFILKSNNGKVEKEELDEKGFLDLNNII